MPRWSLRFLHQRKKRLLTYRRALQSLQNHGLLYNLMRFTKILRSYLLSLHLHVLEVFLNILQPCNSQSSFLPLTTWIPKNNFQGVRSSRILSTYPIHLSLPSLYTLLRQSLQTALSTFDLSALSRISTVKWSQKSTLTP